MSKWSEQLSLISMVAQRAVSNRESSDPTFLLESLGLATNEARGFRTICERVALLTCESVAMRYADDFTTHVLSPGFVFATLGRFRPDVIVMQESELFALDWCRYIDSSGHPHGELTSIFEYADNTKTPLYVISNAPSGRKIDICRAVYFPNLRSKQFENDCQYIPRIIAMTQEIAVGLKTTGV